MSEERKLSISEWMGVVHECAVEHGWWEDSDPNDVNEKAAKLCLIHGEVSEGHEELRVGKEGLYYNRDSKTPKKPEGLVVELGDAVIRIFDYCKRHNLDLEGAIRKKHNYNVTRPYRHGGKKL